MFLLDHGCAGESPFFTFMIGESLFALSDMYMEYDKMFVESAVCQYHFRVHFRQFIADRKRFNFM